MTLRRYQKATTEDNGTLQILTEEIARRVIHLEPLHKKMKVGFILSC